MATFYKGAAIGTHWHANDARQLGFTARSPEANPSTEALIHHIASGTHNSPYISFTLSYAVAWDYAMRGGTANIIPTKNNPGYVYALEISKPLSSDLMIFDPIREVALSLQDLNQAEIQENSFFYQHNGLPDFLLGVVDPKKKLDYQVGRLPKPPGPGEKCLPNLTPQLTSLVNTLRDAEILVYGHIPPSCVKKRFDVELIEIDS